MLFRSLIIILFCVYDAFTINVSTIRFTYAHKSSPCVYLELLSNATLYIFDGNQNRSEYLLPDELGSGDCSLYNGSYINIALTNGYKIHWLWAYEAEAFMNNLNEGFSTVGAEPHLLHGIYSLVQLNVSNERTGEFFAANLKKKIATPKLPYQNLMIRVGNHYACSSGWDVFLNGSHGNATLSMKRIKFQAYSDGASANFTGHTVLCPGDHEYSWMGFHGLLVVMCIGVILVIFTYLCIRIGTLPSPLFTH